MNDEVEEIAEENIVDSEAVAESTEPLTLEEKYQQLEEKSEEYLDGWQRARAEFANAKKRFERDRIQAHTMATASVAGKILPFIDDFTRALANAPEDVVQNEWFVGLQMVQRKIDHLIEGLQMTPIEAVGHPFDPNLHEALSQEPSDEYETGIVIRELVPGYKIGDRVIRPSLVCVAE